MPVGSGTRVATSDGNLILAAVAAEDQEAWLPHVEAVELPLGYMVQDVGSPTGQVYFPVDAVITVLGISRDGASSGVALIGREGLVGINAVLGKAYSTGPAMVQSEGTCLRLPAARFQEAFQRREKVRKVVLRYVASRLEQMAQTGLCNARHSVEERLCRWLLQTMDRVDRDDLHMTQDLIGMVLGVRREAVTIAAMRLQARGAIRYRRGYIQVLIPELVERLGCECIGLLRADLERMARDVAAL